MLSGDCEFDQRVFQGHPDTEITASRTPGGLSIGQKVVLHKFTLTVLIVSLKFSI